MADKSQKLAPKGYVPLRALCVELAAGGVERENIEYVRRVFSVFVRSDRDFLRYSARKNSIVKEKIMWISPIGLFMSLCSSKFIHELFPIHFSVMKIH